jgi:hypothetical protein
MPVRDPDAPVVAQLHAYATRLDDATEPVRFDADAPMAEVVPVTMKRRERSHGTVLVATAAAAALVVAIAIGTVVVTRRGSTRNRVVASTAPRISTAGPRSTTTPPTGALSRDLPFTAGPGWPAASFEVGVFSDASHLPSSAAHLDLRNDVLVAYESACQPVTSVRQAGAVVTITLGLNTSAGPCTSQVLSIRIARSLLGNGATFVVDGLPMLYGPSTQPATVSVDFGVPGAFAIISGPVGMAPPCAFRREPAPSGGLAQPATITLPNGRSYDIPDHGDPMSTPNAVTLDGDGSAPGRGDANGGASLLWGSTNPGGPFTGIDHLQVGDSVVLRQGYPMSEGKPGAYCEQHWSVTSVFTPLVRYNPPQRPWGVDPARNLVLVGFSPHPGPGPTETVYVDLVSS